MNTNAKLIVKCLLATILVLFSVTGLYAQTNIISGVVTDAKNHEPVPGAAVMVKGSTRGIAVGADGKYSLQAKEGETLVCQLFGYKTIETVVGRGKVIDFALEEDHEVLDQAVVVGYGTLKKTQLVGAVENLSGEALEDRINPSITRTLQGQIAGLNIVQIDGKPNHSGEIHIRGNSNSYRTRTSAGKAAGSTRGIGTGTGALVLVDGVEGSLSQVNPDDVETVAVLKDAASASVYGARGAFGVILVTTKKPQTDRVSVNYSTAFTMNQRIIKWEDHIVSDGLEWATAFVDFFTGNDRTPTSSGTFPNAVNNISGTFSEAYYERLKEHAANGYADPVVVNDKGSYEYYGNTNWLKLFYTKRHYSQTHNLSINAASKRISYSLSGRFYGQGNIYKIGNENFETYNLRQKAAVKLTDWATIDNNTSFFKDYYNQPFFAYNMPFLRNIEHRGQPLFVPANPDGTHTRWGEDTGYWRFVEGDDYQESSSINFVTTTGLELQLIKDVLKVRGDFSYKARRYECDRVRTPSEYSMAPGKTTESIKQEDSYKSRWRNNTNYWSTNIVATWTPKLGENHDLNVVGGWNMENNKYTNFRVQRKGILYDSLPSYELMDGVDDSFDDYSSDYSIAGAFGRVNYTFLKRYIFEVAARYDGSSKFPTDKQWGFFPSASVGWRLSEEPFMDWSDGWLDNFKIRANVGTLGNANISPYTFLETMGVKKSGMLFDGQKVSYTSVPSIVPDDLTWEKVTTYDIGLDWDVLKSRLSFSGDYYVRTNTDVIITGPELPGVFGASAPRGNYGKLETKGWEISLSWRDQIKLYGKPLTYSVKGSLWDSNTWVRKYNNPNGNIYAAAYKDQKLGDIWGFRTDGYFLSNEEANNYSKDTFHKNGNNFQAFAGDLKFIDLNGDGKITTGAATLSDHGDLDIIGNETPHYQFGLNFDFDWNGIGLSLFFQGVGHRDWYPANESGFFYGMYNRPYGFLLKDQTGNNYVHVDYGTENWTVTNVDKKPYWTRRVGYAANRNVGPLSYENDYYLQNAAYVRLKNLTVSYTLPAKLTKKVHLNKVKFYLSGENLFTWSPLYKHTDMFDPEGIVSGDTDFGGDSSGLDGVGEGYAYPMLKSYTFGINLSF